MNANMFGGTSKPAPDGESEQDSATAIRDTEFCQSLAQLKRVRNFLNREAITLTQAQIDALSLGNLWAVYFDFQGRMPTENEWEQVDRQIRVAFSHLPPKRRANYLMTETPTLG